jgi:hypothetical protein
VAVLAPLVAIPLLSPSARADSTSPFDAANLNGACAAVELTVSTGYSFVVQPDVQMPRAATTLEEGHSDALASPVDPGDSVDALAGLGIPEAEGYIVNGYPGAPSPFAGQGLNKLPAPLNGAGDTLLHNPFNAALTYPYEHAEAGYPNPSKPGPQTATYAGAPNAAAGDPSGLFTVNAGSATATAGDGFATADGGAGSAATVSQPAVPGVVSLPALGFSVGRSSAHSEAHVLAGKVTADATCTLHDIEVAVPGTSAIHIGAVVATTHAERAVSAPKATASENIEFSGVTVNGQAATLDQNGLTVAGHQVAPQPQPTTLPTPPVTLPQPSGVPVSTTPPTVSVSGSNVTTKQPTADEVLLSATGATITITSTTPLPNGVPPTGISSTPTVYTLHIASLSSEAYGLPAASNSVGLGDVIGGVTGILGGGVGAFSSPSSGSLGSPAQAHAGSGGLPDTLAAVAVTPMQRGLILAISSLLEGLLLAMVVRNFLRARRRVTAPAETTDLP